MKHIKDKAAVSLGSRGGKKRWSSKTPLEKSAHARLMSSARWKKAKKSNSPKPYE